MANGLVTTTGGGAVSWIDVIDRNLSGWLNYFNQKRAVAASPSLGQASGSDVQLAVLQTQLQEQQQQQTTMLLMLGGGAVLLYLLMK